MTTAMTEPSLNVELELLLKAVVNSTRLLYQTHEDQFKIVILLLLAYVAFKAGRVTVTDPTEEEVKKINSALVNRQHYTIYLPQKMKFVAKTRKYMLLLLLTLGIVGSALYYLKHELLFKRTVQERQIATISLCILVAIAFSIWVYEKILTFLLSRGGFNDHLIHEKLTKVITSFGKKTELLLKGYLCKQQFLKRKNPPSNVCSRSKCKEHRGLLKQKVEIYSRMVDSVLNFEWCSICRKKSPFDEYLLFEGKMFEKQEGMGEEKEVGERNQYLLFELEHMTKWVMEISPCNCSKRYWLESTKEIIEFKRSEKTINKPLANYQHLSPLK